MSMSEFDDIIGIFQGDLIIKAAIELSLKDMRENPWVIEDVFRTLLENPILKKRYGLQEVSRAKEFIQNNDIPVYMRHRVDKMEYPCITITMGQSKEDDNLSTLGDTSVAFEDYDPSEINKPIKYIVKPFQPVSYDKSSGVLEVPTDVEEYQYIGKGMILVDPETGNGFIIQGKAGKNGIQLEPGSSLPKGKVAIVPQFHIWRARRERAISQQQYNIGCHVHSDPSTLIFLHDVVKYALYRYREGLLEYNNFQLSRIESTDIVKNATMDTENAYSRWIVLKGQVEESWVKSPHRFIEAIGLNDRDENDNLTAGIKILNQDAPESIDEEDDLWITVDDE